MSRMSPKYLPQVNTPIDIVLNEFMINDVDYEYLNINPNELNASQLFTLSDDVNDTVVDDKHPIWVDNDLNILDGHHKWIKALTDNILICVIKIKLDFNNACRVLNKIQDIYEYEQAHAMEETVNNEVINDENQADSGYTDSSEFLKSLEEDNAAIQQEKPEKNPKTIIAYRKEPIKENSVVGNFFSVEPINGFSKYQIDFDNLLDTNELGVAYKDSQDPVDIVAKMWFPHINFEKISSQYDTAPKNLKSKAIAIKAMQLGYDGVKYGDKIIQGLK
jgi:hypothetical protein